LSQVANQIARNTGALAAARGLTMLLTLGTVAHLTRTLGQEGYGVLGFGTALLSYFSLLARPGLDTLGTRSLARSPKDVTSLASTVTSLQCALAIVAAGLYAIAVFAFPNPTDVRLALLILGAPLLIQPFSLEWVYQGLERMGVLAIRNVLAAVLQLVAALVLVRESSDLLPAAAVQGLALAVAGGALYLAYRSDFGPLRLRIDVKAWAPTVREALPLAASVLMVMVYYNIDKLMLGGLRGNAEVGLYDAAYRWLTVALVPASILYQAFFPALSASARDRDARAVRARAYTRTNLVVGAPLAVGGVLLAGPLIELLAGAAFAPAAPILSVLMLNVALVYLNMSLGQPLIAWDLQTSYMWVVAAGAVANVALNLVFISTYGAIGAAWATLASEAVVLVGLATVHWRAVQQLYLVPILASSLAALVGVGVPVGIGHALALPWWVGAALSLPVYALVVFGSGLVRLDEIRTLRSPTLPP